MHARACTAHSGAAQIKNDAARVRERNDAWNDRHAAQRGAAAQCRAAELLAGGDSGSSMIEKGNSDGLAWYDGARGNVASRA